MRGIRLSGIESRHGELYFITLTVPVNVILG
jgi:hypothetical protein